MSASFTQGQHKMLAAAFQCFDEQPKVDYTKLAEILGLKNAASAKTGWYSLRRKLFAADPASFAAAAEADGEGEGEGESEGGKAKAEGGKGKAEGGKMQTKGGKTQTKGGKTKTKGSVKGRKRKANEDAELGDSTSPAPKKAVNKAKGRKGAEVEEEPEPEPEPELEADEGEEETKVKDDPHSDEEASENGQEEGDGAEKEDAE